MEKYLDIESILKLDIPDIAQVYGGVRGRTMSSRHQNFAWSLIYKAGIRAIIDLREDGIYTRMSSLCEHYGMDYLYYPVDNRVTNIEKMVKLFPEFCHRIDRRNFYIACAMGLHRTDIALCCYWMFYAADKGVAAPEIRGYRKSQGHDINKIMRVLNAFYKFISERDGHPPFSQEVFKQRKTIIMKQAAY